MDVTFDSSKFILIAIIVISLAAVAITLIIVLRDRLTGVCVSRGGLRFHTNDLAVERKMNNKAERIDSSAKRSIRKQTVSRMILDPETHSVNFEVMFINLSANLPLLHASYENHHTRELATRGAANYITDKAHDIFTEVRRYQERFPELTYNVCEVYACSWVSEVLIPVIRQACYEKISYYKDMSTLTNISKTLLDDITRCIAKNERYLQYIDDLSKQTEIIIQASVNGAPPGRAG